MNSPSDKPRDCIQNPKLTSSVWATSIIFHGTTVKEEYGHSETHKGSSAPWVGIREFVQYLKSELAQDEVSRTRSRLAGAILSIVFNLRRERDREPVKFNDNPNSGSSILAFIPTLNRLSNSVLKIKGRHGKEVQYEPQDVERQEERKEGMPKSEPQSRWKSPRHQACTDPLRVTVGNPPVLPEFALDARLIHFIPTTFPFFARNCTFMHCGSFSVFLSMG